ncbi:YSIRK-targeted surface antigen transcriptional regulator [Lachnospiraceae bacterium PF1-21]
MILDIKLFCEKFYNSTFIPITCHHVSTGKSLFFPETLDTTATFRNTLDGFMNFTKNPDYFIADSFSYYGYVKSLKTDYCIIIGPVFSTPPFESTLHAFMHEWAIHGNVREQISNFLATIPQLSFYQFLQTLSYLHFCLNDQEVNLTTQFIQEDTDMISKISAIHSNQLNDRKENQRYHNTYHFERELMRYIQEGDVAKLQKLISSPVYLSEGQLADNALRQSKNILISAVALAMRSAIAGGMNTEEAYSLSDVYIQEGEKAQQLSQIADLNQSMLIDYAKRVAKAKIPQGMSKEIFDCVQFITNHINEPIHVDDVVANIGRSRTYLTKRFKDELGFDISNFIMRCRLEEAKSLLTFSEKSLSEISNYLCFSTQAYFQNVFKKKYGVTPNQYRKDTRHIL